MGIDYSVVDMDSTFEIFPYVEFHTWKFEENINYFLTK